VQDIPAGTNLRRVGGQWTVQRVQELIDSSPFIAGLGLVAEEVDEELLSVSLRLPMNSSHERAHGTSQIHGGPVAALVDIAGDFAVALALGGPVPTINFRTDYLRPAVATDLRARAVCRRSGRTVSVADVDVTDDAGRLVAIGRGTYASPPEGHPVGVIAQQSGVGRDPRRSDIP
jgi:uncharacterized protein (TIGR00369 family)